LKSDLKDLQANFTSKNEEHTRPNYQTITSIHSASWFGVKYATTNSIMHYYLIQRQKLKRLTE